MINSCIVYWVHIQDLDITRQRVANFNSNMLEMAAVVGFIFLIYSIETESVEEYVLIFIKKSKKLSIYFVKNSKALVHYVDKGHRKFR